MKPDLAIVVDVTYCTDYPFGYTEKDAGAVRLGAGPVLCHSPIVPESLNRRAQEIADRRGIPVQYEVAFWCPSLCATCILRLRLQMRRMWKAASA